jgi:putative component of membrane protein insertase Oxa1/YidC/SpoIIIJ protein YidD
MVSHFYSQTEIEMLKNKSHIIIEFEQKRHVDYLFKDKNVVVKYNPISLIFGGLMFFYQNNISILTGAQCPFEYHCSLFSKMCIRKYGLIYGIPLTADRLTRCTRLGSFDLIPGIDYNLNEYKIFDHPDDYSYKK